MEERPADGESGGRGLPDLSAPGDAPVIDRGTARAESEWPRWYLVAVLGSALILLGSLAWVRYAVGGERATQLFSDGIVALGALGAAAAVTHLARRSTEMRRGWQLLAAGSWLAAIGELTWVGFTVVAGSAPYPGLPDGFYLAAYPFLASGFVLLAVDPRDTRPWVRFTLDGLVVATALLTLGWHYVIQPMLVVESIGAFETWISLAYPVFDIVVASIALVVATNARGRRRLPLLVIAAGIFAWVVGDISFAALEFAGGYVYDELGVFWLLGYLAVALGALHPDADAPADPGRARQFTFNELVFPFAPFLLAMAVVAVVGYRHALDPGDVILACVVVILVVVRQAYVSRDAARLGRDLEASERLLETRNEELLLVNRIVRHDIRNDMAVAHGWAGELEAHVDEEGEPMLERVYRTTGHTIDLTETLRDFVEALEPGQEAALEPTTLRSYLADAIQRCTESYPEATFETGDLPDAPVWANSLLGTVFRNLLNNAVQHSDLDAPSVEITATTTDDVVRVRIADDGPGIPDDRKAELFGRGEKGLDSPGSGVGLYLVDTLVGQYGGDVWIEDNEPRGAVFVVELRRAG
jgi:signal transduction histidine kinase